MKPWIMPYHVEKLESGLLVASAQPTYGPSPLKALYGEWWKYQEIKKYMAKHAETLVASATEPKKTYFGVTAADGIDWSQWAFMNVPPSMPMVGCDMASGSGSGSYSAICGSGWATSNSTPLEEIKKAMAKAAASIYGPPCHDRTGLATEYPELRDEFERNLADTPAAR